MASGETMTQPPDAELVALASAGDRDALAALYSRYFDQVYDFLRRLVRDADEAADLVQDVFVKAMSSLNTLQKRERFRSWLFSIAHNTALNRLERLKRVARMPEGEEDERGEDPRIYGQIDPDRLSDPQLALADKETAELVWQAAAGLDRRQYAVLDLHVRQGLDSAEIADVLGVSKTNAYTMVSRMKSAMEESVTAYIMMRRGRRECATLTNLVSEHAAGGLTPDLRRLITRHVEQCLICGEARKRLASPMAVFGAFAAVPPPAGLQDSVWQQLDGPSGGAAPATGARTLLRTVRSQLSRISRSVAAYRPNSRRSAALLAALLAAISGLIVGLLTLTGALSGDGGSAVLAPPLTPTVTRPAAPTTALSGAATVTPTPPPSPTVLAAVDEPDGGDGGPTSSGADTPVEPTATTAPAIAEPTATSKPTPKPTPTSTATPVPDTSGPAITGLKADPEDIWEDDPLVCPSQAKTTTVTAKVTDPSGVASVEVSWSVGSVKGSKKMTLSGSTASAEVGPFDTATVAYPDDSEPVTITVKATDNKGNSSSKKTSVTLHDCTFF